jgi:hypothetical protein
MTIPPENVGSRSLTGDWIFSMQFPAQENQCDVCGKVTLQVHVARRWRCNVCGCSPELDIGYSGQKRHKNTSRSLVFSGLSYEKPWQCKDCGRTFRTKKSGVKHPCEKKSGRIEPRFNPLCQGPDPCDGRGDANGDPRAYAPRIASQRSGVAASLLQLNLPAAPAKPQEAAAR